MSLCSDDAMGGNAGAVGHQARCVSTSAPFGSSGVPIRIVRLDIWFHYDVSSRELTVDYTPVSVDKEGSDHQLSDYRTQFHPSTIGEDLTHKLARLAEYSESQLTPAQIEIDGVAGQGISRLWYIQVVPDRFGNRELHTAYYVGPDDRTPHERVIDQTEATKRFIDNIYPMCEQLAWAHLRERLGQPPGPRSNPKRKVFISYRKGSGARQRFVEAIAHRLGREGFVPWFDEWEIKAGDSIARELASGFQDVYAIVVGLSADYPAGRWAREEMETAITKRIEENIRVIPVLYKDGERPELLRSLRYVDCRDHSENNFERQFSDMIDALNEVDLNPYR